MSARQRPASSRVNTGWAAFDTWCATIALALIVAIVLVGRQDIAQATSRATMLANLHCVSWNHVEWAQVGGHWIPALGKQSQPHGDRVQVGGRWVPICSESVTATFGSTP